MDRTSGANYGTLPNGKRGWVTKNAQAGIPGTQIDDVYMNPLQEELVGGLIEDLGTELGGGVPATPDATNWRQVKNNLKAYFQRAATASVLSGPTSSGYLILPIVGQGQSIILQWFRNVVVTINGGSVLQRVTFPTAFPNQVLSYCWVNANEAQASQGSALIAQGQDITLTYQDVLLTSNGALSLHGPVGLAGYVLGW